MIRQYVGARYVPKFASPVAWASGTSYEAMTIVTYNNSSYTSKIPVPATVGDPADNPDYWALTGNYNAQVEQYRQETAQTQEKANEIQSNLTQEINDRKELIEKDANGNTQVKSNNDVVITGQNITKTATQEITETSTTREVNTTGDYSVNIGGTLFLDLANPLKYGEIAVSNGVESVPFIDKNDNKYSLATAKNIEKLVHPTIGCIGDSYGVGRHSGENHESWSWPYYIQQALPNSKVINECVSDAGFLGNVSTDTFLIQLQRLHDTNPETDIIMIVGGENDADKDLSNLPITNTLQYAKTNFPNAKINLVWNNCHRGRKPDSWLDIYNAYNNAAKNVHINFDECATLARFTVNGIDSDPAHPTEAGYANFNHGVLEILLTGHKTPLTLKAINISPKNSALHLNISGTSDMIYICNLYSTYHNYGSPLNSGAARYLDIIEEDVQNEVTDPYYKLFDDLQHYVQLSQVMLSSFTTPDKYRPCICRLTFDNDKVTWHLLAMNDDETDYLTIDDSGPLKINSSYASTVVAGLYFC